jgi:hypothetical protein
MKRQKTRHPTNEIFLAGLSAPKRRLLIDVWHKMLEINKRRDRLKHITTPERRRPHTRAIWRLQKEIRALAASAAPFV